MSSLHILTPKNRSEESLRAADHSSDAGIIVLNDAAAVFAVLAEGIRGSAVGWPPSALRRLRTELLERYGDVLGGEQAVEQLMALACTSTAA